LAAAQRREFLRARRAGIAAAAIGATAVAAPSAQAAIIPVTTTTDSVAGSLRAAITTANGNAQPDTITFNSGVTGTIHLSGGQLPQITAPDSLTINGPGRDVLAISGDGNNDGTPDSRIFNIGNSGTPVGPVTISGLTLTKGTAAGGTPANLGGAIYSSSPTDVTITDSAVTASTSGASGDGGGIFARGHLTIAGSNLTGNSTPNIGGAVDAAGGAADLTVSNSTISGNTAAVGAGIYNNATLTMTGSTVSGNNASSRGGGIQQGDKYPVLDISDSTFSGNSAPRGGAIAANDSKYGVASHLNRTTISGNNASGYGAGIYFSSLGSGDRFTITHSTLSGNNGGGSSFGGAISFVGRTDGEFNLVDSTISGNAATTGGGVSIGVPLGPSTLGPNGSIAFYNSTIAANSASGKGGGVYLGQYNNGSGNTSATIVAGSTIVADNTAAGSAQDLDRADGSGGGGFNLAFSLVEAPGDAPLTQTPPGSSIVGQDPLLGPLAGNGGPTQTQLPAETSPVIDKGDSPALLTTDQRGDPRRVDRAQANASDGTDIGAVELGPDTTPPNTLIKKKPKKKIKTPKKKIKVKVAFISTEAGSTFQCKLDKGKFKTCRSPFKPKASSKFGKGKKHTIQIRAIDAAGNVDPTPAKVKFTVIRKH
jgi:predicted outer membrane repeat protein